MGAATQADIATATGAAELPTAEGRIEYAVPQVRGTAGWRSAVREALSGRSEELERLAIEMYARGLSVRDIEAAFVDETGRSVLSKSAVSAIYYYRFFGSSKLLLVPLGQL